LGCSKVAERIVEALESMGVPHPLQSHQIHGLDYDHLFPVVQWLVARVIETRRLYGDDSRRIAEFRCAKRTLSGEREELDQLSRVWNSVLCNRPVIRRFRKLPSSVFSSRDNHIAATLLEYGDRIDASSYGRTRDSSTPTIEPDALQQHLEKVDDQVEQNGKCAFSVYLYY
jgi:hypothetical protein